MRALSNPVLLDFWERGVRLHPLDRNLLAVSAALEQHSSEDPAEWPLGQLNRRLAELLCTCFGPELEGWVSCPKCGEKLEFHMSCVSMLDGAPPFNNPVEVNGRMYRLPTSRDLARAIRERDPKVAAIQILQSCRLDDEAAEEEDVEEAGEKMALADPLAEIRLTFDCPECGNGWQETLDMGAFVWAKIEARARRLLREVHTLASAYGWTEREIISLSDTRRAFYLEMIEG